MCRSIGMTWITSLSTWKSPKWWCSWEDQSLLYYLWIWNAHGFQCVCQRGAAAVWDQSLWCPSPWDQFPSCSSSSSRAPMGRGAGWGSLSRWVLWGAPAPFPSASKGQKKTKGILSLLFYLTCRAGSVNPSSCLRVVAVSMPAHSKRLLLSFVTRKNIVQRRIFKTYFADSFSSKFCTFWSTFSFAITNSWLWNLSVRNAFSRVSQLNDWVLGKY